MMKITPSAFKGDPVGHMFNQVGHALIGRGIGAVAMAAGLPMWGGFLIALVGYWLLIEVPQIRAAGSRVVGDGIEDALHFGFGVLMTYAFAVWALVAWLCILTLGAWRRI